MEGETGVEDRSPKARAGYRCQGVRYRESRMPIPREAILIQGEKGCRYEEGRDAEVKECDTE
jgi:hypothetical protein